MTPERYEQIGELYHAALDIEASERAAFLERECGGDENLRREVESLIESHEQSENFIATPALSVAAEMLAQESGSLKGQMVARYRVLSQIGAGGMGRVYLAEDEALGRQVALKLLPEHFTHDKNQVRRFRQEARAASALNHPNILTVYEVGQMDGMEFIATEYVEGETLRERLRGGPFEASEVLDVGAQIASALSAAHEAGIVHRDIKPENVMLRRDGYVKVLDFGLAKLTERGPTAHSHAPTEGLLNTEPGLLMGTAGYMSPEQARGFPVDARSDVWSLGVVLYEMIAGERPFSGETYADTIVSILEREPVALARHAPEVPAELKRIVMNALGKDVKDRYQTAEDMALDLRRFRRRLEVEGEIERSGTDDQATSSTREQDVSRTDQVRAAVSTSRLEFAVTEIKQHKSSVALVTALFIAALAGLSFGLYKFFGRARSAVSDAAFKVVPLTSQPGIERSPAFSPDGKQVAFVGAAENSDFNIYVKVIGAGEPLRLTTSSDRDMSPAWSPDGRFIAFLRATGEAKGYYIVPSLAGAERKLTDAYGWGQRGVVIQSVAWSPDGRTLAVVDKAAEDDPWSIYLVSVETGERRKFTTPPAQTDGDTTVAFSPDGQTLAFVRSHNLVGDVFVAQFTGDIYLAPVAGGDPVRLTSDGAPIFGLAWTPDGAELVFSSVRTGGFPTLWRIPASGGVPAPAVGLGDGVYDPSISRQSNQLAFAQLSQDTNIYRVEVTGQPGGRRTSGTPTSLISSTRSDEGPQFSPDGRRVAFISNRSGKHNLWLCDADGRNPAQLTDVLDVSKPSWSPDGHLIAFSSLAGGNADIYTVSADGGVARRLTTNPSGEMLPSWSTDGRWLYFSSNRTGRAEVWKMPAAGGAEVQLTHDGGFDPVAAPDGRTVYYLHGGDKPSMWAVGTEGGVESRVFDANLTQWNWAAVGRGIYFLEGKRGEPYTLEFFDVKTRRTTPLGTLGRSGRSSLILGLTVAPDERSVLYAQRDKLDLDLMLVENFH
jgi:Tol biopolymer transport system component/serine/threonine protein kinase